VLEDWACHCWQAFTTIGKSIPRGGWGGGLGLLLPRGFGCSFFFFE
jgi:hypothetical protein